VNDLQGNQTAVKGPLIYLIAGEASGDNIGARLMASLKQQTTGNIRFSGIGGPRMAEQGLKSLFPMEELSIMGFSEVLPHIPKLLGRITKTVGDVVSQRPDAVVTIDTPAFSFRVAKKLKGKGIPLIHFVAPSVWAWKPWRAKRVAGFLDHLLTLLPFEPPYFEKEGLAATFVGHPVLESGASQGDGPGFRARYNIGRKHKVLCLLPGSRSSETSRLLPVFREVCETLAQKIEDLVVVLPTVPNLKDGIEADVKTWSVETKVIDGLDEKFDAFAAADVALAASGTVSLELAIAKTPAVIAYKVSPLSAWIAKKLVKLKFVSLVNILTDQEIVPEYLLECCRADIIEPNVHLLLTAQDKRQDQLAGYDEALKLLRAEEGLEPSASAAVTILKVIENQKKKE